MAQTVPTGLGFSPPYDYSAYQFDLSLLSDDYSTTSSSFLSVPSQHPDSTELKVSQIKQETRSPRPSTPNYLNPNSNYPDGRSPSYSRDASPAYPASPYYAPHSPQSAQLYPSSPEQSVTTTKQPVKRERSFDLLTILHESRLLAESLGYKEDSTDCTVPCTPPRTEEDIYNSLDADFVPKRSMPTPLLREMLFKEEPNVPTTCANSPTPMCTSSSSNSSSASSFLDYEKSTLRELLFNKCPPKNTIDRTNVIIKIESPSESIEDRCRDKEDHQLLREVLRDTSFQRKYNLKPIDLVEVGAGYVEDMVESGSCVEELAREQIEPVLSLAIKQLQRDFDNTCVALDIHPEPHRWSAANVAAWLQWARKQLQLPSVPLESFDVDGATLTSFTEEDFYQRAPQCGSMLYAQLEIWKAAVEESPRDLLTPTWTPAGGSIASQPSGNISGSSSVTSSAPGSVKNCNADCSDDEDEESNGVESLCEDATVGGKVRSGGSHIHLWQFLKELLVSPSTHGSCIRWLDRNKGVFKIEDSVRVARLWGKRKNRPAMNYDKLSRSIRQYYKKGIMKKTERSQRLVYQFCHPYCL
ncbi:hypothetical protein QAD02_014304 [Eretmocerus hayati]|uniref:Uncharacterized protein n=1 Tax=Eretmocerus hayati TaxID=131215 RepID=A0ACC2P541_9HYME|nr:hypothetical protein QAD02_014304 [Eretmocerus hayati]